MNDWAIYEADDGAMHVVPRDDLKSHAHGISCWCGPTDDAGVWVHHSADQREAYERGERKPA